MGFIEVVRRRTDRVTSEVVALAMVGRLLSMLHNRIYLRGIF